MRQGSRTEFSLGKAIILGSCYYLTTGKHDGRRTSRLLSSLSAAESMLVLREYCLECLTVVVWVIVG